MRFKVEGTIGGVYQYVVVEAVDANSARVKAERLGLTNIFNITVVRW